MNGPVEIGDVSPRRYFAIVAVVLGLIFAFIAGDDDTGAGLADSLLLWQLQSIVPMALLLLSHMVWSHLRVFESRSAWLQLAISGVTGAVLFSPFATLLDRFIEGDTAPFTGATILAEALNVTPPIVLSWIAINAPFVLGFRLSSAQALPSQALPPRHERPAQCGEVFDACPGQAGTAPSRLATSPPFMRLVPAERRGQLLYLQAELHYLAVVTDRGRSLILYNLRDAVAELPAAAGLLTHRSFWVAKAAIDKVRRKGRQGLIVLTNGDEVPISRRRMAGVDAALTPRGLAA